MPPVIERTVVLCGFSGVGKTTLGKKLAAALAAPLVAPDDFPDRWGGVFRQLDHDPACIVECNRLHRRLRDRIHGGAEAVVIELTAPIEVQRERLEERGESPETIERRIADRLSEGYGAETPRDLVIDTTGRDIHELATELVTHLNDRSVFAAQGFV